MCRYPAEFTRRLCLPTRIHTICFRIWNAHVACTSVYSADVGRADAVLVGAHELRSGKQRLGGMNQAGKSWKPRTEAS
jgi:hypothetical protein